jgi:hypothetical protein
MRLAGRVLKPAQGLGDGLVVEAEMLGHLVEAQTECAKSFDFTSDPLVDGRLRVGQ